MVTPKAFSAMIKHFDEIDERISLKMMGKKSFDEPSLTQLLCYLMDSDTQKFERIKYTIEKLNKKLRNYTVIKSLNLSIEARQFSSKYERWVSESDIGICIVYENQFESRKF